MIVVFAYVGGISALVTLLGGFGRVLVVLGRIAQQHRQLQTLIPIVAELQTLVPVVADIQRTQAAQGHQLRRLRRRVRRRLDAPTPERTLLPCQSGSHRSH